MSARVSPSSWGWWCPECGDGSELTYDTEHEADALAEAHDQRNHR